MESKNSWSIKQRSARMRKWLTKGPYRHIKTLVPGKQGTVAVVEDRNGTRAVAKTTRFDRHDHIVALRKWRRNKKGTHLQAEGLIEQRVWDVLNRLILTKRCPNFVLSWGSNYNDTTRKLTTYSEVWDTTLHNWYNAGVNFTDAIPEKVWQSIFFQICVGLLALHDAGIQHQDLHANNVFIKALPPTQYNTYWTYVINGVKYYCPNWQFAVAISDYGRAFSTKHRVRSSFQSAVDDKLRNSDTNEFYDMEKIFNSIKLKTDEHSFFRNIKFTEKEKRSRRPLAPIIARLFKHYRSKPQGMVNIDTYRL